MTDLTGRTINERYEFDVCLGKGTFAQVYRVRDTRRQVELAAKVLRDDITEEATLERFRRESEVLARLQHPNIVRYYDLIESDSLVFILMDYVPGETLQSRLYTTGRPLDAREALNYLKPLTAALHFAHGEGVIHRDLKPGNILIHENGNLLVTDFGIARVLDEATFAVSGKVLGTPLYMAPEQIMDNQISSATDVYALGVILYQMMTGTVPFSGKSPGAEGITESERITYEHVHVAPTPPHLLGGVSEAVGEVVLSCLKKRPMSRIGSVREVYDALAEAIGAEPSDLTPLPHLPLGLPEDVYLPEVSQFVQHAVPEEPAQTSESQRIVAVDEQPTEDTNPFRSRTIEAPIGSPTIAGNTPPQHPQSAPEHAVPPRPPARWYRPFAPPAVVETRRRVLTMPILVLFIAIPIAVALMALFFYTFSGGENDDEATGVPTPITPTAFPTAGTTEATIEQVMASGTPADPMTTLAPGDLVLYSSHRTGSLNIFVTHVDGTSLRWQLTTNDELNQTGPTWSPDGTRIAFYAYRGGGNADIYVMNADGSDSINITDSPSTNDRYAAWSPDGNRVVFHSNRPDESDGSRDFDLYIYDFRDGSLSQLTANDVDDLGPDWSPDGSQIAFHSYTAGTHQIYTIQPDGAGRRQITPDDLVSAAFPTWSPDGLQLAFHVNNGTFSQIFLINTDGTQLRALMQLAVDDQFPDWSPDGRWVIFQRYQDQVYGLYRYAIQEDILEPVGPALGDFLPDWKQLAEVPVYSE